MYTAHRLPAGLALTEAWTSAPLSPRFVDMVTGDPAHFDTRAAVLWDDEHLYVRFTCEEPFPEAHLTERDSLIFLENDVELFIDGGAAYYELEINARNTVYEVFFIWKDSIHLFPPAEFDTNGPRALTFAGDYDRSGSTFWRGTHPRGARWAFLDYDLPGLQTETRVHGVLNDRSQVSQGWEATITIPLQSLTHLAQGRPLPPNHGDIWNFFFGRFQKLVLNAREVQPHPAWCWSPHGVYDTHMPEKWTPILFSAQPPPAS